MCSSDLALFGAGACLTGLVGVALTNPSDPWEEFYAQDYFSKYVRSAVTAISEFMTRGVLESDQETSARLAPSSAVCAPEKPPHVIVVHDESSFDIRAIPGVRVPEGYGAHFRSFDGKQRTLLVEGAGGPSWYTEYNVQIGRAHV